MSSGKIVATMLLRASLALYILPVGFLLLGIQLYVLLGPYLCFISFFFILIYVF